VRQGHDRRWSNGSLAALAVVGLVATGCGSSSSHAAGSSPGTTTPSSVTGAAAGGGGPGESIGITSKTITLGQLADVSGPVPGLFSGAVEGLDAWAAYVNSSGGIDGRKVVIDHRDSALSCPTYTNGIKQLVGQVYALVGTFSLVDACGEQTLKANPDLLDLQAAILNPAVFPYPTVYSPAPNPPGNPTTAYQWVKDHYGAAAVAKSASLWGSTEQFSYQEQVAAAESIGYHFIYNRGFSPFETNFTADILRMKAAGVEVVDETDDAVSDVADFLAQAAQQGFHPLAVINGTAYDPTFFKLLGNPADAADLVIDLPEAMYLGQDDATVPEIGIMTKWVQTTHPGAAMNEFVVDGWASGLLFEKTLSGLGHNPTRSQALTAIKKVTSFDANGLLPPDDPGNKVAGVCQVIITVKNGGYVRTDPPGKGFECNGTYHAYAASS
jgi:ABC-type branched-subunit amino acid transport system substrate-binding protein